MIHVPVWVEIHVDDEVLSQDPGRWSEARDLIDRVASVAEGRGARLCFRFRETFARSAAGSGFLPALEARGHEIGVHAHGKGLARALAAVRRTGVTPRVAVPGLVQVGVGGRATVLRQAAALGIRVVTDHGPGAAWAYDGLEVRAEEGVAVMAPTVRPFDWGLMERDGTRHGMGPAPIARLRELETRAARHGARWFGLALHEHDLCGPGELRPRSASLDALASFLDGRVVPALRAAPDLPEISSHAERPPSDRRVKAARVSHRLGRVLRQRLPRPAVRRAAPRGGRSSEVMVEGRRIVAQRFGPVQARAALVLSHAGPAGGRRLGLRPFGLELADLESDGWSVWLYDRSGTGDSPSGPHQGLTPGNPDHRADWRAVLARARTEEAPVIALTWSGGLVPVMAAAARGDRPDALVDGEGPVDRWSLVPPTSFVATEGEELRARDPWDDRLWEGLEAVEQVADLGCPYARLQGHPDHVHGAMQHHAERLTSAAAAAGVATRPLEVVAGPLHEHRHAVLETLRWARSAAMKR